MKYFQETTVWDTDYPVPNHIYYMDDSKTKAVGYIPVGGKRLVKFSQPMTIDTRRRKFVVLDRPGEQDGVYFQKPAEYKPAGETREVEGSGGKKYLLTKSGSNWSCSCPGYTFRRTCKHLDLLK